MGSKRQTHRRAAARCCYGACFGFGFIASAVSLIIMLWILWCYIGVISFHASETQRRAVVSYPLTTPKPTQTQPPVTPEKDFHKTPAARPTEARVGTVPNNGQTIPLRGGSRGEAPIGVDERKAFPVVRTDASLAKGDFETRDKLLQNTPDRSLKQNLTRVISKGTSAPESRPREKDRVTPVDSRSNPKLSVILNGPESPRVRDVYDDDRRSSSTSEEHPTSITVRRGTSSAPENKPDFEAKTPVRNDEISRPEKPKPDPIDYDADTMEKGRRRTSSRPSRPDDYDDVGERSRRPIYADRPARDDLDIYEKGNPPVRSYPERDSYDTDRRPIDRTLSSDKDRDETPRRRFDDDDRVYREPSDDRGGTRRVNNPSESSKSYERPELLPLEGSRDSPRADRDRDVYDKDRPRSESDYRDRDIYDSGNSRRRYDSRDDPKETRRIESGEELRIRERDRTSGSRIRSSSTYDIDRPVSSRDDRYSDRDIDDKRYRDRAVEERYRSRPVDDRYRDDDRIKGRLTDEDRYRDRATDDRYKDREPDEDRYRDRSTDDRYKSREPDDDRYVARAADDRYKDRPIDDRYKERPVDDRYKDRPVDDRYRDRPVDDRYRDRSVDDVKYRDRTVEERSRRPDDTYRDRSVDERYRDRDLDDDRQKSDGRSTYRLRGDEGRSREEIEPRKRVDDRLVDRTVDDRVSNRRVRIEDPIPRATEDLKDNKRTVDYDLDRIERSKSSPRDDRLRETARSDLPLRSKPDVDDDRYRDAIRDDEYRRRERPSSYDRRDDYKDDDDLKSQTRDEPLKRDETYRRDGETRYVDRRKDPLATRVRDDSRYDDRSEDPDRQSTRDRHDRDRYTPKGEPDIVDRDRERRIDYDDDTKVYPRGTSSLSDREDRRRASTRRESDRDEFRGSRPSVRRVDDDPEDVGRLRPKRLETDREELVLGPRSYSSSDDDYQRNLPRTDVKLASSIDDRDVRYSQTSRVITDIDQRDYRDDEYRNTKGDYGRETSRTRTQDSDKYDGPRSESREYDRKEITYAAHDSDEVPISKTDDRIHSSRGDRREYIQLESSRSASDDTIMKSSADKSYSRDTNPLPKSTEDWRYDDEPRIPPRRDSKDEYLDRDSYPIAQTSTSARISDTRDSMTSAAGSTIITRVRNPSVPSPSESVNSHRSENTNRQKGCERDDKRSEMVSRPPLVSAKSEPSNPPERPLTPKEVIEAAYRHTDKPDKPGEVFYPVFDPRVSNMTSPEVIRPNERRGTTITTKKKKK